MDVDLNRLVELHPLLPVPVAGNLAHSASIALQRRDHSPVIALTWLVRPDPGVRTAALDWTPPDAGSVEQVDEIRVTEEAAEAVSLGLVGSALGWKIRRRLQRGEYADWLMTAADGELVAIEMSGINGPFQESRLTEKREQVDRATCAEFKVACVVSFEAPEAILEFV